MLPTIPAVSRAFSAAERGSLMGLDMGPIIYRQSHGVIAVLAGFFTIILLVSVMASTPPPRVGPGMPQASRKRSSATVDDARAIGAARDSEVWRRATRDGK